MSELGILMQFYRLNRRMRLKYLDTLSLLPERELLRDRGASFPSMLDIFVHVLDAYDFWFQKVLTGKETILTDGGKSIGSIDEARRIENAISGKVEDYMKRLEEKDLDRAVTLPGGEITSRLGDICWHMVEEELQHRGELNALLWQIDVEPPIGKYRDWVESQSGKVKSQHE